MDEVKAIRINNPGTWQSMGMSSENLLINDHGLSIYSERTYVFKKDIEIVPDDNTELQDMRDIALDECGNIYIVDGKQPGIYKYDRYFLRTERIIPFDGVFTIGPDSPTGIILDKDTIYVADSPSGAEPKIIAYSRANLQAKWISSLKSRALISDIAAGPDGNIYVLTEGAVVVLNRGGEILEAFSPPELKDPTDITVSGTGVVYVLDKAIIHILDKGQYEKIQISISDDYEFYPGGLSVSRDKDNNGLFIGEAIEKPALKTIYRVSSEGRLTPLWTYRDTTRRIINDTRDNIYIINGSGSKLSFLEYKDVTSKDEEGRFSGTYTSKRIDSHKQGNQWHRFRIEGKFPKGTRIRFLYFISDTSMDAPEILRLPEAQWTDAFSSDASMQGEEKREGLFFNNKGRYLWVKLILSGGIESTPQISSLNIYFPRMAYMEILPALYREDPSSSEFLERFLSIFESLISETDFSIAHISRYMDVLGAPAGFLSWLGKWLSMRSHNVIAAEQKRNLLLDAMKLYKIRGTRQGIEGLVRIITGQKPFVVENIGIEKPSDISFKPYKKTLEWCKNQTDTIFVPSERATTDPFNFCVLLKETVDPQVLSALKEMIDDFKPAHTSASIRALEPWFYLEGTTYLGVNTVLNRGDFILEEAVLGRNTHLTDIEACAQVSRKARVEIDFKII